MSMGEERKIPLVVGVTGHINLRDKDRETLKAAVKRELSALREQAPHTPLRMLCSLAAGVDLLCSEAAEELGIPVTAPLPLAAAEYEKDFSPETLREFRAAAGRAESVFAVPAAETEPEGADRDFWYRQAGIFVAEHCHVLLALWDGKENGLAAGSAATVRFALDGAWRPVRGMAVRTGENTRVIHILTLREGETGEGAGEVRYLGNETAWEEILTRTEEFNALAEETDCAGAPLIPGEKSKEATLLRTEALYAAADGLSLRFAKEYRKALAALALAGTLLAFSFLLYDNGEILPMILVFGILLLLAFFRYRKAARQDCHRRFIEYRVLAETLRVQGCLRHAGSRLEAQRLMTWSQQQEEAWILCAVSGMNAAPPPEEKQEILSCWVEDQKAYHERAGARTARQLEKNDRWLGIAMRISVVLYVAVLVYELVCGGLIFRPALAAEDAETGRKILLILLGTLSAGTLFLANYYGKMSLNRVTDDHGKMVRFYEKAEAQLKLRGQEENLLETLAREELTENGNWSSYQRDNAPELNL